MTPRAPCPRGHHGTASPGTLTLGGLRGTLAERTRWPLRCPRSRSSLGTESHRLPGLPAGDACQGWIFCLSPFHVNYQRAANVSSLLLALSARRLLLAGLPCKKRAPQPWGGMGVQDPSPCCLALQGRCVLGWTGGQAHLLKHPAREGAGSGSVSCHLANTKLSSKERKTAEKGMVLCRTWIF